MTLNGVMTLIFRYFTEIALKTDYVTVVEDRPIMSAECPLPLLAKTGICSSRTVSLRLLSQLFSLRYLTRLFAD